MQADGAEIEFGQVLVAEGRCTSLLPGTRASAT